MDLAEILQDDSLDGYVMVMVRSSGSRHQCLPEDPHGFHKEWTGKGDNSFLAKKSLQDTSLCGTLKIAISEINTI